MTTKKAAVTNKKKTVKKAEPTELEITQSLLEAARGDNRNLNDALEHAGRSMAAHHQTMSDLRQQITNLKIERTALFQALWDCQQVKHELRNRCGEQTICLEKDNQNDRT